MPKRLPEGQPVKSEVVSIRLSPRLKYLADLAARSEERTISNYVEWVVRESLKTRVIVIHGRHVPLEEADREFALWDVDPAEKLAKLALLSPELLSPDEQMIWRLIRDTRWLWSDEKNPAQLWNWLDGSGALDIRATSINWSRLRAVALNMNDPHMRPHGIQKQD